MRAFFLRAVEALPLAVFLLYMAVMDPRAQAEWRAPYFASTALAVIGTVLLLRLGATLNRIYLGITLYFVSGTIALLTRWPWINEEYGRLCVGRGDDPEHPLIGGGNSRMRRSTSARLAPGRRIWSRSCWRSSRSSMATTGTSCRSKSMWVRWPAFGH